ncbi:hypothetical protein RYH73_06505 [Olivibacter sp. CPCC 100613]|uniref:M949_RS01915 family surface polysaccharide biosynthesis protein n=1 Tax=Olivibacter sp. CPCC 100613 TaxID=3079931 RepID=UPI002FFBCF3F
MKNINILVEVICLIGSVLFFSESFAQKVRALDATEIEEIAYDSDLDIPVFMGFEYRDKGGLWDMLLLEDGYIAGSDTATNASLEGILYLQDHGGYLKKMVLKDFIKEEERDIRFWTSYCSFLDLDNDGYIDPILVYASYKGDNNLDKEPLRIKIFILYKRKKIAISARECVLDGCRSLKFDKDYSALPSSIRRHVFQLMEVMRNEKGVVLKDG